VVASRWANVVAGSVCVSEGPESEGLVFAHGDDLACLDHGGGSQFLLVREFLLL